MTSSVRPLSRIYETLPGAYFREAREAYQRAVRNAGISHNVLLRVAGILIQLRFAGDVAQRMILPTLAHLIEDTKDTPQWIFHCWDDASTRSAMPMPTAEMKNDHRRNCLHKVSDRRYVAFYQEWMEVLSFIDREGEAYACYLDASSLPMYERAAPLRQVFNTALNLRGCQIVHAAAVGDNEASLLIAGPPRSGKSTLAVQCLLRGMRYQSDDLCILSHDCPPRSWSLYNVAKIREEGVGPISSELPLEAFTEGEERKYFFHVNTSFPDQILPVAPVKALLIPKITGEPISRLSPATALDGMRALLPYSISEVPTADNSGEKIILKALGHLPVYHLHLGSNSDKTCLMLKDFLRGS